jgi:hypothetical protein
VAPLLEFARKVRHAGQSLCKHLIPHASCLGVGNGCAPHKELKSRSAGARLRQMLPVDPQHASRIGLRSHAADQVSFEHWCRVVIAHDRDVEDRF